MPEGDDRERLVCRDCGFIHYENPKVVVGTVATWQGRFLICRRDIDPRRGFWTIPAGYLELGETTAEGALREAWEEARARLEIDALLAVYNIPRISQVQLIYCGRLSTPEVAAGPETQEVGLFDWAEIPWDRIAPRRSTGRSTATARSTGPRASSPAPTRPASAATTDPGATLGHVLVNLHGAA